MASTDNVSVMSLRGYSNFWTAGFNTGYSMIANLSNCINDNNIYNIAKSTNSTPILTVTFVSPMINSSNKCVYINYVTMEASSS